MAWVVLRKEEVEQPTDKSEPSRPETVSPDFQQPVELKNIQQLQHWVHHEKQLTKKKCKNTLQKCIDFSHFHLWMWKSTIHPKSKKGNFSSKTWPVSYSESVHTCVKSVCCCQYPLNILKSMTSLPLLEYHFQLSSDLSWEMKAISTTIFLFFKYHLIWNRNVYKTCQKHQTPQTPWPHPAGSTKPWNCNSPDANPHLFLFVILFF